MNNAPTSKREPRVTWASDIEPKRPTWLWEEFGGKRIAVGTFVVAAGREGTGKSGFGIATAARLTRGTLPGSLEGIPSFVFYCAVEDSWAHTLVPRFMAAGADLSKVGHLDAVKHHHDGPLAFPRDIELLEQAVKQHRPALVVLDPLTSFIEARINTHNEREVRQALDPLVQLAERTNVVILGIAHFSKARGVDAASLITGSGAFKNVPRAVFGFVRDETDINGGRLMTQVKNSLATDDLPSIAYNIESVEVDTPEGATETARFCPTGLSERTVADVLRELNSDTDIGKSRSAKHFIKDYLIQAGGEAQAREVLDAGSAEGYSPQTLKNARSGVADTRPEGYPAKPYWVLLPTFRKDPGEGTRGTGDTGGTTSRDPVPPVPLVPQGEAARGPSERSPDASE